MIELLQFRHSPYNEKVRWALDLKGVPHRRRSLLPGPHMRVIKSLTGQTATPVLVLDDGHALHGSAQIIEWLDQHFPQPLLIPAEPAERAEALRIQAWFDTDLTPRLRRPILDALLREPSRFAAVFGDGRPAWQRLAYRLVVPLAAPLVRRGNGILGEASLEDGLAAGREALDFVSQRAGKKGYLVGRQLSIADITAAATLAALFHPAASPMACPGAMGGRTQALIERFGDHPGIGWMIAIY